MNEILSDEDRKPGMTDFSGAFGDKRRDAAVQRLEQSMVERSSVVVHQLGGTRAGEVSAHRVLSSAAVTPEKMLRCIAAQTAAAAAGLRVLVVQDTVVLNFLGRMHTELGPTGRCGKRLVPGFFMHTGVAVAAEPDCQAVLGTLDVRIWTREANATTQRRQRVLADKESYRWLQCMQAASKGLGAAREVIVTGDAESDIYALFARRPSNVHLLVRVGQNRATAEHGLLFDVAQQWSKLDTVAVQVVPRLPGQAARVAQVELRADTVTLCHPRNARREGDPETLSLTLVEAQERDAPAGVEPLHWRLLTTLPGSDAAAAAEAVQLYRLRWRIEIYQSCCLRNSQCHVRERDRSARSLASSASSA
jgi:hypothetical protein